jgi:hypothetical protein
LLLHTKNVTKKRGQQNNLIQFHSFLLKGRIT